MIHPGQIPKGSPLLQQVITLVADGPGNGVDKIVDSFDPGYPFQVESVQIFADSVTSQADVDVRIGSTSVLAAEETDPTAESLVEPTLSSTKSDLRGDDTESVDLVIDTDGGGDITARVRVVIRPHPAGGEPGSWKAPPGGSS